MTTPSIGMSALAITRSQEVKKAQLQARKAEDGHRKLLDRLRRQVGKARGQDHRVLFRQPAPSFLPAEYPMPRTGLWRCGRRGTCTACSMGTCRTDPDRQENGCKCHTGKRCKVWDQTGPCYTSYEDVPATARALQQTGDVENQAESIASSASSVTFTADSLKQTCKSLTEALANVEEKLDALVETVEAEEEARCVKLQHLPGLSVKQIRTAKHSAVSDTEDVVEEAEALIKTFEEQDLGEEEEDLALENVGVFDNVAGPDRSKEVGSQDHLTAEDSSVLDKILQLPPPRKNRLHTTSPWKPWGTAAGRRPNRARDSAKEKKRTTTGRKLWRGGHSDKPRSRRASCSPEIILPGGCHSSGAGPAPGPGEAAGTELPSATSSRGPLCSAEDIWNWSELSPAAPGALRRGAGTQPQPETACVGG